MRKLYIDFDLSSYQISDLTGWSRTAISDYLRKNLINKESIKSPIPRYGEREVSGVRVPHQAEQKVIQKIISLKTKGHSFREIETLQDGVCDVYVVLDAISGHCFGMETSKDLPSSSKILGLIKTSCSQANTTPKSIFILKKDPLAEAISAISDGLKIKFNTATKKELAPFTDEFSKSFRQFKMGNNNPMQETEYDEVSKEEVEAFIPDTYGPCPCASGKKYKFCCQKSFKDITFAMCAAQEGNLEEALFYMGQAESKIGSTAEILSRYGICWSFFDRKKSDEYMKKALSENINAKVNEALNDHQITRVIAKIDTEYSNSMIEAFFRSLKNNFLYFQNPRTLKELTEKIEFYINEHNFNIPHSAHNGLTPEEVYKRKTTIRFYNHLKKKTKESMQLRQETYYDIAG